MRLYYVPRTRAARPRWVLEELGVPYELVRLDPGKGETRSPEHLARHPLGHVPVLEDRGAFFFESAAICLYLADRFPEKGMAPAPGTPERGELYQWLFFAMTEMEVPLGAIGAERKKPDGVRDEAALQAASARFAQAAAAVDGALRRRPWLLGDAFTIGDVVVGGVLQWGRALRAYSNLPAVDSYVARLRERPAWQRATAD
jgi:glutathione S-transferase